VWLGGTWDQRGKHTVLVASKQTALVLGQTVQKPGVAAAFCRAACSAAVEKVERWPGAGGRRKACTSRPSDSGELASFTNTRFARSGSSAPPRARTQTHALLQMSPPSKACKTQKHFEDCG